MNTNLRKVLITGLLLLATARLNAESIKPQDFAFGLEIQTAIEASVYELDLPLQVYQQATQSDLRDIRVFNAAGEVVPYALRFEQAPAQRETLQVELPLFPLRGDVSKATEDLQIRVLTSGPGLARDVMIKSESIRERDQFADKPADKQIVAYLIDARAVEDSISVLQLNWQDRDTQFVANAQVEASDNLNEWQTVVRSAPVLQLQHSGHALLEQRIHFPNVKSKYLRLTFQGANGNPIDLKSVQAESTRFKATRAWLVEKFAATQPGSHANKHDYHFELPAAVPLRSINILLPQPNTVVTAELLSRLNDKQPWQVQKTMTLYRLQNRPNNDGAEIQNRPFDLPGHSQSWLLRVNSEAALGAGVPTLQVMWEPHKLLFVARGAGPFMLTFGNALVGSGESALTTLLPSQVLAQPSQAKWGRALELGGEKLLKPKVQRPWKTWLLWSALIIAVALLAWMAKRLMSEMSNDGHKQ